MSSHQFSTFENLNTLFTSIGNKLKNKQDKLTFDTTPTVNSNNPVTSDGIKTALNTSQNTSLQILNDTVGWSGKNILVTPYYHGKSYFDYGITYTVDPEGRVIADGTATNWSNFYLEEEFLVKAGRYILTGTPETENEIYIAFEYGGATHETITKDIHSTRITFANDTIVRIRITVKSGEVLNNLIFEPMLRLASINDDTYEPYHENVDSYTNTKARQWLDTTVGWSNKQLLPFPYYENSTTKNGITFSVDSSDGSVIISGTATDDTDFYLLYDSTVLNDLAIKGYISKSNTKFVSETGIELLYSVRSLDSSQKWSTQGGSIEVPLENSPHTVDSPIISYKESLRLSIRVANGTTISSPIWVYPLICLSSITDLSYEVYHKNVNEILEDYVLSSSLGTAAAKDVPSSGNASTSQVVMGNDSRLTDSRTPKSHTHTKSEITDFPTLGTAAAKDVPSSGNASTTQVVMGNDSRLSDTRTPKSHTHTKSEITDFPTIPSINNCYQTTDTTETALADGDYIPFYDTSATGKRKTLWSNIKSVLKTYFDTLYSTVKTSETAASGGSTLSLVTTGEKYTWNNKAGTGVVSTSANGLAPKVTDTSKFLKGDGTWATPTDNNTIPTAYCSTAAATAAKAASCTNYTLLNKSYINVLITTTNSSQTALTLNINGKGAKAIYINGSASSTSNYTLPAGSYLVYYDGTNYYFRTDGKITGSITGDAATVNGKTVAENVPSGAKFTDTTYGVVSSSANGLAPKVTDTSKYLKGDGTWATPADHITTATTSGSGNAVTAISADANGALTVTKGSTFLTSHQTIKQDGITGATVNRFGTCSTAAGTAAKTVSITSGTFALEAGVTIAVKFSNKNTADSPTLAVNSTAAKNIFVNGSQITNGGNKGLLAGTVVFIYDGTQYNLIGNYYDTNTTYSSKTAASGGTDVSLCTTGEKYTWNNKPDLGTSATTAAKGNHTHTASIAADSGTSALSMAANTKYKLTAGGSTFIFTTPPDSNNRKVFYGTCSTAADAQVKVVTLSNTTGWELVAGTVVAVKFTNTNTYSATAEAPCKLNINSTGDKQVYYANSATPTGTNTTAFGKANYINTYVYDGTYWVWQGSSADNNTTYTNVSLGQGYATDSRSSAATAVTATLGSYALTTGGIVAVKFNYDVPANATLNINSKGAKNIYYRNAKIVANIIKAGDVATFIYSGNYYLISIDHASKSAASGGTDLSLVTTGEKYTWNQKTVKQTAVDTDAEYDVLFSNSASTTTEKTEQTKKSNTNKFTYNPSTGILKANKFEGEIVKKEKLPIRCYSKINIKKPDIYVKTWNGFTDFSSSNIWTDGENIYCSRSENQYILNKSTSTWTTKTWNGFTNFSGSNIWTDGENIYYSNGSNQYILNKSTSTWTTKTWNGLTNFSGDAVWTDGENIYFSWKESHHYILNKSTSTWTTKTWNGFANFYGNQIWTDGENIYCSTSENLENQYILNKSTSTWTTKTWNGLTNFSGIHVWTDGENIYYSNRENQYILNKSTSTWTTKTWNGLTNFSGYNIWTDGENIYFSNGANQYQIIKPSDKLN